MCNWKLCKHPGDDSELIKEGGNYYHPDCLLKFRALKDVREFYNECHLNEDVNWGKVNRVLNTIIYKEETDPEFLLFSLKFNRSHGRIPKHPEGLYYFARDDDAKRAWEKSLSDHSETHNKTDILEDNGTEFTYKPLKKRSLVTLLYGEGE